MNGLHFAISTSNKEAQQYFDQGLLLSFAFNHAEAARSFYQAARLDTTSAMSWWGFAYVLGPNYNAGMEPDNFQRASTAVQKAISLRDGCTQKEKDLILALAKRYSSDSTIPRSVLDQAYAVAMGTVYRKYPADVTIASLFAESLMDLHPWALWRKDGTPETWTPEIMTVLETGLRQEPRHIGINHFYIHAVEMSGNPGKAMIGADLLETLVPASGHLVHMPSHIYIRTGRYHRGVLCNMEAAKQDSLYVEACNAKGMYPLAYFPHNYHFLAACATLDGESVAAIAAAEATAAHSNKALQKDPAWATLQHYSVIPLYVEVKLGLWEKILASPAPDSSLSYPSIIRNYALGMAALAKGDISMAKRELYVINQSMKDSNLRVLTIWNINNLADLATIAAKTLEGEILARTRQYPAAIRALQQAVDAEDALNYNEPPDWFFSVRQHLGAVLLEAGLASKAIEIYQQDLERYPENGWALRGLMNAYELAGDRVAYEDAHRRFVQAWKYADITIRSSRIL